MVKILRVIAVLSLVVVGAGVVAVLVVPRLFGSSAYVVTSGSMLPTFGPGSVVVTQPVQADELAKGDIVTYVDGSGGLTTHRVAGFDVAFAAGETSTSIITKGDANEEADPASLDPRNIVGKAEFAVPHLGYLVNWIKTPLGAGIVAALFLLVMFGGRSEAVSTKATVPESSHVPDRVAP